MPRALVLGNGNLLVNIDSGMNIRDLYFPYVGMDNHIGGHRCGISYWEEGYFSRIPEDVWRKELGYLKDTLVTQVKVSNPGLKISFLINDTVHYRYNIFLRRMRIKNEKLAPRLVRIFFNNDFSLGDNNVGDTVLYDPVSKAVVHYKRKLYVLMNGTVRGKGIYQFATGLKRFGTAEGTWRDAEDGWLEGNPIAHGSVDSTVSFEVSLDAGGEAELWYWIVLGESIGTVRELNDNVKEQKAVLLEETAGYWEHWVNKHGLDFADLPQEVCDLFKRSLLITRTQCDNRGAILAANDTFILTTARDHYSYLWPRDGALIALGLDQAGYQEITLRFFQMSARILSEEGYYYQKYNPDGSVGSSWHPWIRQGELQLPIQEDETALVCYALWNHYCCFRNHETLEPLYHDLVVKIAEFLLDYRDPVTKLPRDSYDLWEERRGVFCFTTAAVYGGLLAAANFADLYGDDRACAGYRQGALEVKEGIERYLYSGELGRFLRGVYPCQEGFVPDYTLDSSLYGLFGFGVFAADDPRVVRTMEAVRDGLWIKTDTGGLARYAGDWYFRRSQDLTKVPGNPWIITTLWLGEWYTAKAKKQAELDDARSILEWVTRYTMETGVLSEQIHPYTGEPLSVAPLTWSHGAYVLAVTNYLRKYQILREH